MLQKNEEAQKSKNSKGFNLLYNPYIPYEDNYIQGPPIDLSKSSNKKSNKKFNFLDNEISLNFGIPAGPLLNSKFIKAAFELNYNVSTYKTVRTDSFPCHPFPNILPVKTSKNLEPKKTPKLNTLSDYPDDLKTLSITNSFGVPSKQSEVWINDVKKSLEYQKKGQLLILSFMGTIKKNQTQVEFAQDFAYAAELSCKTGVKVIEANLSCPNIGNEGLVCYNIETTELVCKTIRSKIGNNIPLVLKVGYYENLEDLQKIAEITNKYADAIATINTLQVEVVDRKGNQALPGSNRLKSGICGSSIKWAGLEMVTKLNKIRKDNKYKFQIVGIGGVMTSNDYFEYIDRGADLVQAATGPMWNPYLANQIIDKLN